MKTGKLLQQFLLALGVIALVFLLVEIAVSVISAQPGNTPARIENVTAGPYRFKVSLSDNPARAGFALPFTIAPQGQNGGQWTYQVTSIYDGTLTATPVRDSVGPDPNVPGGAQGAAEITVQGPWHLQVVVTGPLGQQMFQVPVTAVTLAAIPTWLGWALGFIPVYGIVIFLFLQGMNSSREGQRAISIR
jgi:hypothetical protein